MISRDIVESGICHPPEPAANGEVLAVQRHLMLHFT
jgi:hypothetical protein